MSAILDLLAGRRSIYSLDKQILLSKDKIQEIVEQAAVLTPSAFNSQSARVVLLTEENHDRLWEITMDVLRGIVPAEAFASTEVKIRSFAAGAGTVLYFEEMDTVTNLQESFPLYKDNFPVWSQQANAMLQLVIWVALENEGLGVSLQHYNPLIDEKVKAEWKLPDSWKLIAQMPFGNPTGGAKEKDTMPAKDRVKIY